VRNRGKEDKEEEEGKRKVRVRIRKEERDGGNVAYINFPISYTKIDYHIRRVRCVRAAVDAVAAASRHMSG